MVKAFCFLSCKLYRVMQEQNKLILNWYNVKAFCFLSCELYRVMQEQNKLIFIEYTLNRFSPKSMTYFRNIGWASEIQFTWFLRGVGLNCLFKIKLLRSPWLIPGFWMDPNVSLPNWTGGSVHVKNYVYIYLPNAELF